MIKTLNAWLLPLLCLIMAVAIVTSCKKTNDAGSTKTELISFGPTGAKPGDTLRFFGNNLDRVTSIQFTGTNATVDQKNFIQQSSQLILVKVPAQVERGLVTLKATDGDIVSKTPLDLSVKAQITSMTTQARPGENVTINGDYLNWVRRVTFAKDKVLTTFVTQSKNQLVVTVPADAQTGPLVLFYAGTDSTNVQTTDTLKVTLPVATSFSPNPVKHQTNLTINGTNLDLTRQVLLTGASKPITTFVSQTATQLVVKVDSSTVKGKVTLVAASGVQSVSTTDLDVLLPAITPTTGMTPSPVDPGANLTITGTNLDLVTSISFQNAPAVTSFVSQTPTQIVVKVPLGVLEGKLTLGVLNSKLTVQSPDILKVNGAVPPPTLALPIFTDALSSNWTNSGGWLGGGWGGTSDINNTSPVREGTKSVKITYSGGYGSPFQIGGANISLSSYTTFKISIYGAPGSGGKTVTIGINGVNGKYNINVVEGKWTDYAIPLSTLTSDAALKEIWVQEYSGTGGFTIYVDAVGLS
jgi:hypothetical protein